jgi:hypothetical protein
MQARRKFAQTSYSGLLLVGRLWLGLPLLLAAQRLPVKTRKLPGRAKRVHKTEIDTHVEHYDFARQAQKGVSQLAMPTSSVQIEAGHGLTQGCS